MGRNLHKALDGKEMWLRRLQEQPHEWGQDLGARFKVLPVTPTILQKRPLGEGVERLSLFPTTGYNPRGRFKLTVEATGLANPPAFGIEKSPS